MQQEFRVKHYIHYQSVNIMYYGLMLLYEFQLTCSLVICQNCFFVVFTLTLQDLVTLLCGLGICSSIFVLTDELKLERHCHECRLGKFQRKGSSIKVKTLLMAL